jgi:hypothetical protein
MSEGVEVLGVSMLGCLQGLREAGIPEDEVAAMVAQAGLANLDPEGWYPQQPYLDLFRDVEQRFGEGTLRAMARQVPDHAEFPPGIHTLVDALQTLDIAYQLNHRGGTIGRYAYVPFGPKEGLMVCENPYGCAFDLGILEALVARFCPDRTAPVIRHRVGTPCRRFGAEACTYHLLW